MTDICHILLIEDDTWLREGLAAFFRNKQFMVTTAADLHTAKSMLHHSHALPIRVIIADVTLPDGNSLPLFQELNLSQQQLGKILISANITDTARIEGLKHGADDYICKPVNPDELLLRVSALLRRLRYYDERPSELKFLNYTLHLESRQLSYRQHNCQLSESEHQLLLQLIARQGRVVGREELSRLLTIPGHYAEGRALDILVSRLRKKLLLAPELPDPIITYRSKGYMLIAQQ